MRYVRVAIPCSLLLAGAAAIGLVFVPRDATWKAIWIGLASTCLAAGLVDGSALLEARRREKSILRLVGDRVGLVHQRFLWIIRAAFDIVENNAADLPGRLREFQSPAISLQSGMPQVMPPTTRLAYAMHSLAELEEALAVATDLAVLTNEAHRLVTLGSLLRSNHLVIWLRYAAAIPAVSAGGLEMARAAADALETIQTQFRFFSKRGGSSWRYGKLN